MRVSPLNSISFKSIPLYDVKLKKQNDGSYEELPATFSKLESYDADDISIVKEIPKKWQDAPIGTNIAWDFLAQESKGLFDYEYYGLDDITTN